MTSNIISASLSPFTINVINVKEPNSVKRVKCGSDKNPQISWISPMVFACLTSEDAKIRVWNLENEVADELTTSCSPTQRFKLMDYMHQTGCLVAITESGLINIWKKDFDGRKCGWRMICTQRIEEQNEFSCVHCFGNRAIVLESLKSFSYLKPNRSISASSGDVNAIQTNKNVVWLKKKTKPALFVDVENMHLKGLAVNSDYLVLYDTEEIRVFQIDWDNLNANLQSSISMHSQNVFINNDTLILIQNKQRVLFTDLNGASKMSVSCEDIPIALHVQSDNLVIATHSCVEQLVIEGREYRYTGKPIRMHQRLENFGKISYISCNADGNCFSFHQDYYNETLDMWVPDTRLFVYKANSDTFSFYDMKPDNLYPQYHCWDTREPTLLSCEASSHGDNEFNVRCSREIITFFVTENADLCIQSRFSINDDFGGLLGLSVPYVMMKLNNFSKDSNSKEEAYVEKVLLDDFVDFENVDAETQMALLNFSRLKAMGKLEEALHVIHSTSNPFLWEKLAHECIKSKRVDIAEVCLASLGYARGAHSIRIAKEEKEPLVAAAALAIQLGQLDDAISLYKECGRFDLLTKLYIAQDLWEEALDNAEKFDKLNLKKTQFLFARYITMEGDIDQGIKYFEKCGCASSFVPRLLYNAKRIEDLEHYCHRADNLDMSKWMAAYCESLGLVEQAVAYYDQAGDVLSLVRIACSINDLEKAAALIDDSGCKASALFLARQLEGMGQIREAIEYYRRSGIFSHAIRLSKAYELHTELMSFALQSRSSLMHDVAQYFEEKHMLEKAATLYSKSDNYIKAFSVSILLVQKEDNIEEHIFELIDSIIDELEGQDFKDCILQYVDVLMECNFFSRAIRILCSRLRRHDKALELCVRHDYDIPDDLVEIMIPKDKEFGPNKKEDLFKLASYFKKKGKYLAACKTYTFCHEKVNALKCLVKGGLTSEIIKYAYVSRNKEIFILSANYLQHL